jgi:4-amino-4-deoxy-L-arabinose transferase-like glycosyltransferase
LYGDEGIYASAAQEMSHGEILYKDIWDNKPHGIYLIYMLFRNSQFWIRTASLIAGLATIIGVYLLGKKLLGKKAGLFAFLISVFLIGSPLFEGNIAHAENFFIASNIWGFYLGYKYLKNNWVSIIVGILFACAAWLKINAITDFAGFVIFVMLAQTRILSKKFKLKEITDLAYYAIGFILPIAIASLIEILQNNFSNFFNTVFLDMFRYIGYNESSRFLFFEDGMKLKLVFPVIAVSILSFNYAKKNISKKTLFIGLIFTFQFLGTIISSRHYSHYLLQVTTGFALFTALFARKIKRTLDKTRKICLSALYLLIIIGGLPYFTKGSGIGVNYGVAKLYGKNLGYKLYAYYENFVNYKLLKKISFNDYSYFFNEEETHMITLENTL